MNAEGGSATFYCYEGGKLRKFTGSSIKTVKDTTPVALEDAGDKQKADEQKKQSHKKYSKGKTVVIAPRNEEQVCAFDLMKDPSKTVKLLTGSWGTGKTMILVSAALEALKSGRFEKVV